MAAAMGQSSSRRARGSASLQRCTSFAHPCIIKFFGGASCAYQHAVCLCVLSAVCHAFCSLWPHLSFTLHPGPTALTLHPHSALFCTLSDGSSSGGVCGLRGSPSAAGGPSLP